MAVFGSFVATGVADAAPLPMFQFNPAAVGLNGTAFAADNILLSDYATVQFTTTNGVTRFTDRGVLQVTGFQLSSPVVSTPGLNAANGYGLYFVFDSGGTQNTSTFGATSTGTFDTLNYTLYGFNAANPTAVTFNPTNATPGGVSNPIALATGSLVNGAVGATMVNGVPVPNANTFLSFTPVAAALPFFASPVPFYNADFAAFTNTQSQVTATSDGFVITQGGGVVNFATVPEPASMLLLGSATMGLLALRRRA